MQYITTIEASQTKNFFPILIGIIGSVSMHLFGGNIWSSIGIGLTLYVVLNTINNIGRTLPIIDLMSSMMTLQWVLGPFIEYRNINPHYKYHMYVDEITYMSFIVPAIIAFIIGTSFFKTSQSLNELSHKVNQLLSEYPKLPYVLIIGGLVSPYIGSIMPSAFGFVFYLLSNVKYIGIVYLLLSGKSNRWPIFIATFAVTIGLSLASGMFHDLLLWLMLLSTFIANEFKMKSFLKIGIAIIGILLAMTIQSVKGQYREIISNGFTGNKAVLFWGMALNQWQAGNIVTPSGDTDMNVRLNQGWIISAIMNHVPKNQPHAEGETIKNAITSSLVPRFLAPNKTQAGGRENFRKFTGLHISEGTSMGISLAGEGWANYGYWGGIIFLFGWGIFVGWLWKKIHFLSILYPTIVIWSPIIFLQVIKAETEFVVVLNHMVKASFLILLLLWFVKRQWGHRIC